MLQTDDRQPLCTLRTLIVCLAVVVVLGLFAISRVEHCDEPDATCTSGGASVSITTPVSTPPPWLSTFGTNDVPRIYIVEELKDRNCTVDYVYYDSTSAMLYAKLLTHPWRTLDPESATLFYIPFDTRGSYAAQHCGGRWHHERMEAVFSFLRRYKYFLRHRGRDFFWDILYWQVLHADNVFVSFIDDVRRITTLKHIILGSFLRFHRKRPLLYPGEKHVQMPKDHLFITGLCKIPPHSPNCCQIFVILQSMNGCESSTIHLAFTQC
jgi:hypothetical protein